MSIIVKEIDDVMSKTTPPKALFKVERGYGGGLSIKPLGKSECFSDSPIKKDVLSSLQIRLNHDTCQYDIVNGIENSSIKVSIVSKIVYDIKTFILRHHESKNPKLTSLYRWWTMCIDVVEFDRHDGLEDMVYHTWRYIETEAKTNREHAKNALKVLELIKSRYEAKGLKRP